MSERELRAVTEAIAGQVFTMHALTKPAEFEAIVNRAAQVAISASDSQYVMGLVEALSSIARNTCCDKCQEAALVARDALQNLPEDLCK